MVREEGELETRMLPVELTEAEFADRARQLAETEDELAEIDQKRKAEVEEFKRQAGTVISRRQTLAKAVKEHAEDRSVDCTWHANWKQKQWELSRKDTNEIISAITMSPEELQLSMETDKGGDKKPKRSKRGKKKTPKGE